MLKNTSNSVLILKYNGQLRQVAPGQTIDIGVAYDLPPSEVMPQEARMRAKHAGLVDAGKAGFEVSSAGAAKAPIQANLTGPDPDAKQPTNIDTLNAYSKKELLEMVKNLGIEDVSAKRSKEALVKMIDEAMKKTEGVPHEEV